jgi:hypothetical protein
MKIDCVDEKAALKVTELCCTDEAGNEALEGLAPVERWGQESPEGDIGSRYLEHVAAPNQASPPVHLGDGNPRGPRGGDQRADTRSHDEVGNEATLLQGPEHADVGQPFEAAATENQGEGTVWNHNLPRHKVTVVRRLSIKCKNRAPERREKGL